MVVFVIIYIQTNMHVSCCVMSCASHVAMATVMVSNSAGVKWCRIIREFLFVDQGKIREFNFGFPVGTRTCPMTY